MNIKEMFIPHYIMGYVSSAVLVSYVNSQKGEFVIVGHTRLLYVCLLALLCEDSILEVTLVHVLSLTMNIFGEIMCKKNICLKL